MSIKTGLKLFIQILLRFERHEAMKFRVFWEFRRGSGGGIWEKGRRKCKV